MHKGLAAFEIQPGLVLPERDTDGTYLSEPRAATGTQPGCHRDLFDRILVSGRLEKRLLLRCYGGFDSALVGTWLIVQVPLKESRLGL